MKRKIECEVLVKSRGVSTKRQPRIIRYVDGTIEIRVPGGWLNVQEEKKIGGAISTALDKTCFGCLQTG